MSDFDGISCDHETTDAQVAEVVAARVYESPWHARRAFGFGASDVPALLVGLGRRDVVTVTGHVKAAANRSARWGNVPRIVAEKAGLKAPLKHGGGGDREAELIQSWRDGLPMGSMIDRSSVEWEMRPQSIRTPVRDPECEWLAATLDGWAIDVFGDLIVLEAKCGDPNQTTAAWPADGSCPWFWASQVQAQMAATTARSAIVICGVGWSYRQEGPIVTWHVERDDALIAEIRACVVEAWAMVEKLREK